jgi:hypothetical protein
MDPRRWAPAVPSNFSVLPLPKRQRYFLIDFLISRAYDHRLPPQAWLVAAQRVDKDGTGIVEVAFFA